jgi:hypothetical protein
MNRREFLAGIGAIAVAAALPRAPEGKTGKGWLFGEGGTFEVASGLPWQAPDNYVMQGVTLFVDPSSLLSSDYAPGTDPLFPKQTIASALDSAEAGSVIYWVGGWRASRKGERDGQANDL